MAKDTIQVNSGAMPKIDRGALMPRAWAIFRQTYKYPQIKFSDIGRKCFAWALRQAWVEPHATPPTCPIGAGPSMTRRNLMNSIVALPIVTALPVAGPSMMMNIDQGALDIELVQAAYDLQA